MKNKIVKLVILSMVLLILSVSFHERIKIQLLSIAKYFSMTSPSPTKDSDELDELKNKNNLLEDQLLWKENRIFELNRKLRNYKMFTDSFDILAYAVVPARVVGEAPSQISRHLVIDKGTDNGIQPGCPVVWGKSVVGITGKVSGGSAIVKHITDSEIRVPAVIRNSSHPRGMIHGTGAVKNICALKYIPVDIKISREDHVITSGMAGVFPRGVLIGKISDFNQRERMYYTINVQPRINFHCVEEVLVLVNTDK